jgi:hypothetical protein
VYRDWHLTNDPFGRRDPNARRRREDAQSFETALVAALLGGLSEAIEKNNQVLFTALGRKDRRMRMKVQAHRRKRQEQILAMGPMTERTLRVVLDARRDFGPVVTLASGSGSGQGQAEVSPSPAL